MKKILKNILLTVLIFFTLCSCARQRYINEYEFAKLFNKGAQEYKLNSSEYYKKSNNFSFILKLDDARDIMLTLTQNDKLYITQARMTMIKASSKLTEKEQTEFFNVMISALSILLNCTESEIENELKSISFDIKKIDFADNTEQFSLRKADCFFCSNNEMISFYVEIK